MSSVLRVTRVGIERLRVLPGFFGSLGIVLLLLAVIVVAPIVLTTRIALAGSLSALVQELNDERLLHALLVSFRSAAFGALLGTSFALPTAWVLARYQFPGKDILSALVDIPLALPTAVSGITLAYLYSPSGAIGRSLESWGIQVAYQPAGIVLALVFVTFPLAVRVIEPVIAQLEEAPREAAATLGASDVRTFLEVTFPELRRSIVVGYALAFARGVGEYGSVIFIAGNMPMQTEIAPLLIVTRLEQFDYGGALAIAMIMLIFSVCVLFGLSMFEQRASRGGA